MSLMTGLDSAKYSSDLKDGSAIELAYFSVELLDIEVHTEAMSRFLFGLNLLLQPDWLNTSFF